VKWVNHRITTFAVVFIVTRSFVASLISAFGSVIPDAVEGHNYSSSSWKKNHRKISHWLLGYVLIAIALWAVMFISFKVSILSENSFKALSVFHKINSQTMLFFAGYGAFFAVIGAILHILEDALSAPVPLLNPSKRVFCIGLMKTGSIAEYFLSISLFLLSIFVWQWF